MKLYFQREGVPLRKIDLSIIAGLGLKTRARHFNKKCAGVEGLPRPGHRPPLAARREGRVPHQHRQDVGAD